MMLTIVAALALGAGPPPQTTDPGPLVRALWLVQDYGTPAASAPGRDQATKATLAKALGKDGILTLPELGGLMQPEAFKKLAGADNRLDPAEIQRAVEAAAPESRRHLLPRVREHADYLTTTFDLIDEPHREAGARLSAWIAANDRPGQPLHVVVICTGNSRRSILGATMGNIAAAYYGMPEIRFHSGGTAPTAFNPRTARALEAIGVEIEPTGREAPRGEPQTPNPISLVRWGVPSSGFEATEFSKHYTDPSHPPTGFAALMVCGEADAGCPVVRGASVRIAMPYLDPKIYDSGAYEAAKYAERRDDIGRLMLSAMQQARRLRLAGKE